MWCCPRWLAVGVLVVLPEPRFEAESVGNVLREIFGGALEAAVTEEVAHAVEVLEKEFPGEERHGQAALDGEAGDILQSVGDVVETAVEGHPFFCRSTPLGS